MPELFGLKAGGNTRHCEVNKPHAKIVRDLSDASNGSCAGIGSAYPAVGWPRSDLGPLAFSGPDRASNHSQGPTQATENRNMAKAGKRVARNDGNSMKPMR